MHRVFFVYGLRLLSAPGIKLAGLGAFSVVLLASVSVQNIFQNTLGALSTPRGFLYFIYDAFFSTELFVQLFFLATLTIGALVVHDAVHRLRHQPASQLV